MIPLRRFALVPLALLAASCADQPVLPEIAEDETLSVSVDQESSLLPWSRGDRAAVLNEIPVTITPELDGWLTITHLDLERADGTRQLFADGVVSWLDAEGRYVAEAFEHQPIDFSRAATVRRARSQCPGCRFRLPRSATFCF